MDWCGSLTHIIRDYFTGTAANKHKYIPLNIHMVRFCLVFLWLPHELLVDWCDPVTHILQGYFTSTGANEHTVYPIKYPHCLVLLGFLVDISWVDFGCVRFIHTYPSGLFHWHWGNRTYHKICTLFCYALISCGYLMSCLWIGMVQWPISFRVTLLALGQTNIQYIPLNIHIVWFCLVSLWFSHELLIDWCGPLTHILQGYFTGTGAIVHTVHPIKYAHCFVMLWFLVVISWVASGLVRSVDPYPSGLLHWHWGNCMIAAVPVK